MAFAQHEHKITGMEPIALIGIGCTLPGNITSTSELLSALRTGRDLVTEVPSNRWNVNAYYDPDPVSPGKTYVRKGSFIEDIESFDSGFFGISDIEATRMDPQQRLILQTVWHALEDAGQPAEELVHSNTGMFLAMMNTNGYSQLKGVYEGPLGITGYDAMGDSMSIAAGRVSHFLGLEGPCLTLDTACSSSLVALHLARQSLLSGESDMAIVAGVNIMLHPGLHVAFSKLGLMSRAGRCASFDASADGYVRGEGCMAIILRRQSDALTRGDHIYASILSTSVNQDGHTPALTAPNGRSQEKVIRSALARVGISPDDVRYVEAHGTGTPVGDPIEMSAIVNVFGPGRSANNPLYVGSVKSNFGHIEAGAGLLGLVKTALSLEQEEIFPSIHFTKLNPSINFGRAPVQIASQHVSWPRNGAPRLAGVNSFGYSGTNAHAILQEAPLNPGDQRAQSADGSKLLFISGKSQASLDELIDKWADFLEHEPASLADLAYSAAMDRSQHPYRVAVLGKNNAEIKTKLESWRSGHPAQGMFNGQVNTRLKQKVAFMFTGQGAQYAGMARELFERNPRFADTLRHVAALMDADLGAPLLEVLFGEKSTQYLENTRYVQPALFAVEYALADLLGQWGLKPDYVIGHSIGELVAAVVAGMLDLEDAASFVVTRGRLMGNLPAGGKMLAINASVEQAQKWVEGREDRVSIATVNGPRAVVVSGAAEAVEEVNQLAQAAGRHTKELEVSHAFHSPLMEPILEELSQAAAAMRVRPARIPVASNTTGAFFGEQVPAGYWSEQVRQAVLFHQGMQKIIEAGCTLIIEIGPHPALTPAVVTAFDVPSLHIIPTLKRDQQDETNLLTSLSSLYISGAPLKFENIFAGTNARRVHLPLYPFRHEKYWLQPNGVLDVPPGEFALSQPEASAEAEDLPALPVLHPILGKLVSRTTKKVVFENSLRTSIPWTDHRVLETTIFPGTGYLEMAARGFAAANGKEWKAVELKDVALERPLTLSYRNEKPLTLTLEFGTRGRDVANFKITSDGVSHCHGRIVSINDTRPRVDLNVELAGRTTELKIGSYYNDLRNSGIDFGARFANLRELWQGQPGSGEAFGRAAHSPSVPQDDPYRNTILMDSCQHSVAAAFELLSEKRLAGAFVPAAIQSISMRQQLPNQVWSHIQLRINSDGRAALANIKVVGEDGEILLEFENLELRRMTSLQGGKHTARPGSEDSANQLFKSRQELAGLLKALNKTEQVSLLSKWLAGEIKQTMGQAADSMGIEKLPASTVFLEIGLDSLLVTELQRRIQEKLEFRFKPMQGLDYQSIESLAEFLLSDVLANDLQPEATPAPAN
ncbi:MAG: beta-ketoacyl synthase N-terminal-like domain-containing protein [Chloroflexi bacterium]|nr:beta-ketoacyl synthase N-terminal-like domain-containing protein [Chloroflexota bacterium]